MRIAHVTDCYLPRLGGIEWQVHDLAHRQQAMGHDVTVVTSVAAGNCDGAVGNMLDGVAVHRPAGRGGFGGDGVIRYTRSLSGRSAVLSGRYDAVHVHASTFSPLAFLVARAASHAGIPTAVTVHSLWAYASPLFGVADRLCGWADWPVAWSAVSSVSAEPLRRMLRARASVALLPNAVDPAQWRRSRVDASARDVRLISVMRLARRKRPLALLSMLRAVARQVGPSVRLTAEIIGDGPQRASLERYLRRHDMTGWVNLAGSRTRGQIGEALARADVFVTAAVLESFGIAALEARSAGLAVVARAGTGVEDFIVHGREGMLARSDDDMVAAIVDLVQSTAVRARITAHNQGVPPDVAWCDVLARCDELYRAARASQNSRWGRCGDDADDERLSGKIERGVPDAIGR
jgi:glycosyltransferase involved in cell wall biosynthesis